MNDEIKLGSTYRICETCGAEVEGMFKCKCDLSKAREFWIEDNGGPLFDARVFTKPQTASSIHVIEYSAVVEAWAEAQMWRQSFDSLEAERDKLKAELEAWRNDSIVAERDEFERLYEGLSDVLDSEREKYDELRAEFDSLEAERDQLKKERESIKTDNENIRRERNEAIEYIMDERDKLQSELAEQQKLHERTRELRNQEIDKLRADLDKYRLDADKRYCDVEDENDKLRAENKSIIENYNQVEVEKLRSDLAIAIEALEQVADTKTHFGKQNYIIAQEALAKLKGEE